MRFLGKQALNYVITTKKGQTSLFFSPNHQSIIRGQVNRKDAKQPEIHEFSHTKHNEPGKYQTHHHRHRKIIRD